MHRLRLRAALLGLCLFALCAARASAQTPGPSTVGTGAPSPATQSKGAAPERGAVNGNLFVPEEVRRELREQREQLEVLRATLGEQARLIAELRARMERAERAIVPAEATPSVIREAAFAAPASPAEAVGAASESGARRGGAAAGVDGRRLEDRVAAVEAQA